MPNTIGKSNLRVDLKHPAFLKMLSDLKEGDRFEIEGGFMTVEAIFDTPTHFPFSQRIFDPGMILKKEGRPLRVYVPADKIGLKKAETNPGQFTDRQKKADGTILPADPETQFKRKEEPVK
jgi:hypothetical protein